MGEIFLKKEKLDKAVEIFRETLFKYKSFKMLKEEEIPVFSSLGRITSRPVYAKISHPFFNASAVDGYALAFSKTAGASINTPKEFSIGIDTIPVNTGEPVKSPFDCVVMIEDVIRGKDRIRIFSPLHLYENVRVIGEDFSKGEIVVPVYEKIRPEHIGVLIASGHNAVYVFEKPKVYIIPTGEEVKRLGEVLSEGDVIDSNSFMIASILESFGASFRISDRVLPNDVEIIRKEIEKASHEFHIIVLIGGSAKGSRDYIVDVLNSFSPVLFHGLNIQPGKPLAISFNGPIPLIGLPGFPVSSFIDAKIFLKIAVEVITGYSLDMPEKLECILKRAITSPLGVEEFVRVKVTNIGGENVCVPLKKGAANISTVSNGDGVLRIEENIEGIEKGTKVIIDLFKGKDEVLNQLLFVGSNDPLFEFYLNFLKKEFPWFKFGIINAGSLGGLLSFLRGETIITSIHLFDLESNSYNTPYLKKYLGEGTYARLHFANRNQGLIVRKGNPKGIKHISDLIRDDIRFVNRQSGSGTRVFLDYLLEKFKVNKSQIRGYEMEEITHLGVANAVLEGIADCGMGIEYVARVFDLDFVKLGEEEYEIIIRKDYLQDPAINLIIKNLNNENFLKELKRFAGYSFVGKFKEA